MKEQQLIANIKDDLQGVLFAGLTVPHLRNPWQIATHDRRL